MKKIILAIAIIFFGTFSLSAQYNDSYNQTANYKSTTQWQVGNGLMIAGLSTLGAGVLTFGGCMIYIAVDENVTWESFVKSSLFASYFVVIAVPIGTALSIVGGCLRASAKNHYTSYQFNVGDRGSYAQLGLTQSGNMGISLTF